MDDVRARVNVAVAGFTREFAPWRTADTVVAAVSGGPDSLCLLGALLALQAERPDLAPGRVVVAHLDHGLRGAFGAADAAWVGALAARLGLLCVSERFDVAALARRERRSIEDAARQARYAFLRRVAAAHGAVRICVGHTRDDQVETIVMHWLRGSGLTGLAGMRPLAGDVARPLLGVARAETVAYCAALGWEPRHDATNDDPAFLRNRIRHVLLPELERYNPNLRETLLREAVLIREDERYLEEQAATLWRDALVGESPGTARFAARVLRAAPSALVRRIARRAADHVGAGAPGLGATHIQAIESMLARGRTGASLDLPGRLRVSLEYGTLSFERRHGADMPRPGSMPHTTPVALPLPGSLDLPALGWRINATVEERAAAGGWPGNWAGCVVEDAETGYRLPEAVALLDADVVEPALAVRTWLPGDRMRPLGMSGSKKLQDVFGDAGVPRRLRHRLPLVVAGSHVLWVAGLRIDDAARVTPETRRVLRLRLEPLPPDPSDPSDSPDPSDPPDATARPDETNTRPTRESE